MSLGTTLLLGLIAGGTILLGLPVGRMRSSSPRLRVVLNTIAIGILLFLFWDVLSAAWEPLDAALADAGKGGSVGPVAGYGALFAGGLAVGLLSLVGYDRYLARNRSRAMAASVASPEGVSGRLAPAYRLALLIAVGIGLHNFAEGLAIGQSAASGEIQLATLLVIGFALHNATEGFGIVAPIAGSVGTERYARPSWGFLLAMGAIGGGPTLVGTLVGHSVSSPWLGVLFLTLAAGSILYVVVQLLGVAARAKLPDLVAYGLLTGLLLGFATDAIVTAAGA
jgi:ZIP family zinc transporter